MSCSTARCETAPSPVCSWKRTSDGPSNERNSSCTISRSCRLQTDRIEGFEALLRWRHPDRGLVMPGDFIAVAEETGIVVPIGWWVLREACRQMSVWQSDHVHADRL